MLQHQVLSLIVLAGLGCALRPGDPTPSENVSNPTVTGSAEPSVSHETRTYLQPNSTRSDGTPVYVHVTKPDMPWRIAIGHPAISPRYGSRADAREAAIEAMRMWEEAIQPHAPWFRLVFVEEDPSAPVQVRWKRRVVGSAAGRAGIRYEVAGDRLRIGGEMTISTRPRPLAPALTVDEVRLLTAHEFGHVLGLMHCLDCDSAMNYSWHTRDRIFVTESDVQTFLQLLRVQNGSAHGE
jgi:hypothetical protein